MTDVKLALRGLRGESFADVLRRTGAYGVQPTDSDAVAIEKLNDEAEGFASDAEAAATQAGLYAAAAAAGTTLYASTSAGLAATSNGQYFRVIGSTSFSHSDLYLNSSGSAVFQRALPSLAAFPIFPEVYGAAGNGTTVDTQALLDMITAGGTGAHFRGLPGKVYLYDGELIPLAGQTFEDMEFKRADQAVTTLTANMTDTSTGGGSTLVLNVTSTTAFRVGSYVTITKATPVPGSENNTDPARHRITAKTSTTLTVFGGFTKTFASGDEVISAYHLFSNTAADVRWLNVTINGNRANWQNKGLRWETITEIRTTGDNCHIRDLKMTNCPGEGVQLGGDGSTCTYWTATNTGGNPIHFSGGDDLICTHFRVDGANRVWFEDNEAYSGGLPVVPGTLGHEDGGVAWSLFCPNVKVAHGTIKNALSGFSPPVNPGAEKTTIFDVTVEDCALPFKLNSFDSLATDVHFVNCRFNDCGRGQLGRTKSGLTTEAETQLRTLFTDCHFFNTALTIDNVSFVWIRGGSFVHETAEIPSGNGVIVVNDANHVRIETLIDGADYGVLILGASEYVDTSGTTVRRAITQGVGFANVDAGMKGNRMKGGAIAATSGVAASSFVGVAMNGGDEASGIEFDFLSAVSGAKCIQAGSGSRHFQNVFRIATGVVAVHSFGGTTGIIAKDNVATVYAGTWDLTNSFVNGGGGSNHYADNLALVA